MKVNTKRVCGVLLIFLFLFGIAPLFVPETVGQQSNMVGDRAYWLVWQIMLGGIISLVLELIPRRVFIVLLGVGLILRIGIWVFTFKPSLMLTDSAY